MYTVGYDVEHRLMRWNMSDICNALFLRLKRIVRETLV